MVEELYDQPGNSIEGDPDNAAGNNASHTVPAGSPVFAGPTSSDFSLGLAKIILKQDAGTNTAQSGLDPELAESASCWEEEDDEHEDGCRQAAGPSASHTYSLHLHDALRLLWVYHECVGVLHPIVDMELLEQQCKMLWQPPQGLGLEQPTTPQLTEDQADLKLVLAIALLAEGGGSNAIASQIHNDLQPAIANQMLVKNFTIRGQILLLLGVRSSACFDFAF